MCSRRDAEHSQRFVGSLWCAVRYAWTQAGGGDKDEQENGGEPGQADADPLTGTDRWRCGSDSIKADFRCFAHLALQQ